MNIFKRPPIQGRWMLLTLLGVLTHPGVQQSGIMQGVNKPAALTADVTTDLQSLLSSPENNTAKMKHIAQLASLPSGEFKKVMRNDTLECKMLLSL